MAVTLDEVVARMQMLRSEIKTVERHARIVKQLAAQCDEAIQSYSQEAQGNDRLTEKHQ